jgi:uncharacterized LabA/DUF88 family protein
MASIEKPWMMFVDGENLTMGAQRLAAKQQIDLTEESFFPLYKKDTYFWPTGQNVNILWWPMVVHTTGRAERCYYYTSARGDGDAINAVHDKLAAMSFSPVVIKKESKEKKSKGVDITLTKDMLVHAFLRNYDVAVLVSGDGDFLPVVEELKRLGKWIVLAFFGEEGGLNPKLRRAADQYIQLGLTDNRPLPPPRLPAPQAKSSISIDVDLALKSRLERLAGSRTPPRNIAEEAVVAIARHVEEEERREGLSPLHA